MKKIVISSPDDSGQEIDADEGLEEFLEYEQSQNALDEEEFEEVVVQSHPRYITKSGDRFHIIFFIL